MTHNIVPPRDMNRWERRTIESLLSREFPGVRELRRQLPALLVSEEYPTGDPSVIFSVQAQDAPAADIEQRVPVEAEARDRDGAPVQILLHVLDGFIWELEVWRGDGQPLQQPPDPASLKIHVKAQSWAPSP